MVFYSHFNSDVWYLHGVNPTPIHLLDLVDGTEATLANLLAHPVVVDHSPFCLRRCVSLHLLFWDRMAQHEFRAIFVLAIVILLLVYFGSPRENPHAAKTKAVPAKYLLRR